MISFDVSMNRNMAINLQIRKTASVQGTQQVHIQKKSSCPFAFFTQLQRPQTTPQYVKALESKRKKTQVQPLPFGIDSLAPAELVDDANTTLVLHLKNVEGETCSIFKPHYLAEGNTSKFALSTQRETTNEVIAYQMDRHVFNLVPETKIYDAHVQVDGVRQVSSGSIQAFVEDAESCADYGSSLFQTSDVHKIGLLDCRILNLDRHLGNILFNKAEGMIPIDHALSLPSSEQLSGGKVCFDWLLFPQAKQPFGDEIKQKIRHIQSSWRHDVAIASRHKLPHENISLIVCANVLVSVAALEHNKTLFDIGQMIQRTGNRSKPSIFEEMLTEVNLCDHVERVHQQFSKVVRSHFELNM